MGFILPCFSRTRSSNRSLQETPNKRAEPFAAFKTLQYRNSFFEIKFQPIRSTTKIWVVNVISMKFLRSLLKTSFCKGSFSGDLVKRRLFSQANAKQVNVRFMTASNNIQRY